MQETGSVMLSPGWKESDEWMNDEMDRWIIADDTRLDICHSNSVAEGRNENLIGG